MHKRRKRVWTLHSLLWYFAFGWAVCFLALLINDGMDQNPALMILALTELVIHAVWILLDRPWKK
jgi:hypothetical protein